MSTLSIESRWLSLLSTAIVLMIVGILSAFLWYLSLSDNGTEIVSNERITPKYHSIQHFREDIEKLVREQKYDQATELLLNTEIKMLVDHAIDAGDLRWMAIYEDTLVLPGLDESIAIRSRPTDYWVIPDTSDAIIDVRWQTTATEFAKRFNLSLQQVKKDESGHPR